MSLMSLYSGLKLPAQRMHIRDATIGRRVMSFIADIVLLNIFVYGSFNQFFLGVNITQSMIVSVVAMSFLTFSYFVLFEYVFGQSVGMMILGLVAQDITLWRAILRNIYFIPIFPFPLIALVEPFYLIWKKKRFLEVVSNTRTIEQIVY